MQFVPELRVIFCLLLAFEDYAQMQEKMQQ